MNFAELWSNPSMLHAAVVHLPIAAAVFGLVFIVISAIFHRNNAVRAATAFLFLLLSASAYIAIETGEDARERVPNTLPAAVWDQIDAHSDMAEKVMYAGIFTLICMLVSLIRVDAVRVVGLLLALVGAIVTNVFVAQTGHLGGALVYNHGVGTPLMHEPPPSETPVALPVPAETSDAEGVPEEPNMPAAAIGAPLPDSDPADWVSIRDYTMEEAQQVSYIRDIWPIIDEHCIDCHEDPDADGEFDMTTVENMLLGGEKAGPGVVPGQPDESAVVKYIRGILNPRMPKKDPPLPEETLHLIRMWIAAGAIDDSNAPPTEAAAPAAETPVEPAPETAAAAPEVPAVVPMKEEAPVPAAETPAGAAEITETAPAAETPAATTETTDSATAAEVPEATTETADSATAAEVPAATTESTESATAAETPAESAETPTTTEPATKTPAAE